MRCPPRTQLRLQQRRALRGVTLLEVGIALVLLGLMLGVAAPALTALAGARLKENTGVIAGAIRDTFARTALLGRSTRLVLDFEQQAWWVEETQGVARLKAVKQSVDKDGKVALNPLDRRAEGIEADTRDVKEQAKLELLSPPEFVPVPGEFGQPVRLPSDVRFKRVWVEHLEDFVAAGQVALYFFPGGFTEEAIITLTDDDAGERTLSIVVQPLTGEVFIERDEPRIPRLEDDE
jgi:type II secretory pathway pseudopilin PulG